MSGARVFARGLACAALLAALAPLALLALGPFLGGGAVLRLLLGAAAALALAHSLAVARGQRRRAAATTALFILAGLALASWLAVPGLLGGALALWGFGLVLSLRVLLPGSGAEPPPACGDDAFEAARARALALLEQEP